MASTNQTLTVTVSDDITAPGAPIGVQAQNVGALSFLLTWSTPNDYGGHLFWGECPDGEFGLCDVCAGAGCGR
jgi:hypothetical protein